MACRKYAPERIIGEPLAVEAALAKGETISAANGGIEVAAQANFRRRREYGDLTVASFKNLKYRSRKISDPPRNNYYRHRACSPQRWSAGVGHPIPPGITRAA
jgi:hypothetical protein